MIETGELRRGVTIEIGGTLYQLLDVHHLKIGRGSAQVRMKLRDIKGGHTIERTVQAGERFTRATLETRSVQFLYTDDGLYHFMDTESFEQFPVDRDQDRGFPALHDGEHKHRHGLLPGRANRRRVADDGHTADRGNTPGVQGRYGKRRNEARHARNGTRHHCADVRREWHLRCR